MSEERNKTSTGINQDSAGLLCYLGWWITGIIFLVLEKENKIIRFHAVQSIIVFGLISIVLIVFSPLARFSGVLVAIVYIIDIIAFILWVLMMVLTAQGKMIKLPWAGGIAEKYAKPAAIQTEKPEQPAQKTPPVDNTEKKE